MNSTQKRELLNASHSIILNLVNEFDKISRWNFASATPKEAINVCNKNLNEILLLRNDLKKAKELLGNI